MRTSLAVMLVVAAAAVPAAGQIVNITGSTADYHVTLPEGNGPVNTLQGLGPTRLGTFRETRNPPSGRPEAERRGIFQFDLSSLQPLGNTITSASFSVFLPNQNSGFPTHDLDLWGSSVNRASPLEFTDPAAGAEFDAASYALVRPTLIPRPAPPQLNQRYAGDVTPFLQARYADFLANPSLRYVFFRTQVAPNAGNVNAFYELNTAEAGGDFVPRLTVNVVPAPGALAALAFGAVAAARRRRSMAR